MREKMVIENYLNLHESLVHEMIVKISKGYQLTIPAEMRKELGIDKGSEVLLRFDKKREKIFIEPFQGNKSSLERLFQEGKKYPYTLSIEEMEKIGEEDYEIY